MTAEPKGVAIKASWEITTWHFEDPTDAAYQLAWLARRPGDTREVDRSEARAFLPDVILVWGGE